MVEGIERYDTIEQGHAMQRDESVLTGVVMMTRGTGNGDGHREGLHSQAQRVDKNRGRPCRTILEANKWVDEKGGAVRMRLSRRRPVCHV